MTIILAAMLLWPFTAAPTPTPRPAPAIEEPVATPEYERRRAFCGKLFRMTGGTCLGRPEELGGCDEFRAEFCPKPTATKGGKKP